MIEILVALTILAMALGVIFGALRLGISSWEKGNQASEESQRRRIVLDLISQDIKSAFFTEKSAAVVFLGAEDELRFFTTSVGLSPGGNLAGPHPVSYFLKDDAGLFLKEGYPWAIAAEDVFKDGSELLLDPDVTSIKFGYYQGDEAGEARWVEVWDSKETKKLPAAVEVTVSYGDDDKKKAVVVVPTNVEVRSKVVVTGNTPK